MENKFIFVILIAVCVIGGEAVPKKYEAPKSNPFMDSYPENEWRRSGVNDTAADSSDRTQRLGYGSTGYGGLQGYPNSGSGGVGVYSPLKLDLGGVVVGALVGIGALLILPKLVSAFSGGSGSGYNYRNIDGDMGVTDMISKLDDFLGQNNIDSSACMQRAVCSFVRSSEFHMATGQADQMEALIHSLTGNSLVDYIIDGTAIKEAVENGKNPNTECDYVYRACPLDKKSAMDLLSQFLPRNNNKLNNNALNRP